MSEEIIEPNIVIEQAKKRRPPKTEKAMKNIDIARAKFQKEILPKIKEDAQIKRDAKTKEFLTDRMKRLETKLSKLKVAPESLANAKVSEPEPKIEPEILSDSESDSSGDQIIIMKKKSKKVATKSRQKTVVPRAIVEKYVPPPPPQESMISFC